MSFTMKASSSGSDFPNPTPGAVSAVCVQVIGLGTQEVGGQFPGQKNQVRVAFEIDERRQDGLPFLVSRNYTLSFHPKAALRAMLESWRGKKFGEDDEFDLESILGKHCLLNLVQSDQGYINIDSVSGLPKGAAKLQHEGALLAFNLVTPDWETYNVLPVWLQEKIQKSPEYGRATGESSSPSTAPATQEELTQDFDDDIPF